MDAVYELIPFIVNTNFNDLPNEAVEVAKKQVFDVISTTLGGNSDARVNKLYQLIKDWGGAGESRVIAHEGRFPAPNAALVNSTMSNVLDFDDIHEKAHLHVESTVVPSALAVSEYAGGVSGKELIAAICVADELGCRLGMSTRLRHPIFMGGWSYGEILGYFMSAAVSSKILKLDNEETHNALGIAYHLTSGNNQAIKDKADTKVIGYGFASHGGITAALMARNGLKGARDIFTTSETSFFNLYHSGSDVNILLGNLGKDFQMADISFKPYPCCRLSHAYVDVCLKVIEKNDIEANEILEVVPHVCHDIYEYLCIPQEKKKKPETSIEAQFSLQWIMACAITKRMVGLSEFDKNSLCDHQISSIAARINPLNDSSLKDEYSPAKVQFKTKTGSFEVTTGNSLGSPQNPMTYEDLKRKLIACSSISLERISDQNLEQLILALENLESLGDVRNMINLVVPAGR